MTTVLRAALAALFLLFAPPLGAQPAAPNWDAWDRTAANAEDVIASGEASADGLATIRARLEAQAGEARQFSQSARAEVDRLTAELAALGEAPEDGSEAPEAAQLRDELTRKLADAKATQGRADRVVTRASDLRARLTALDQERFLEALGRLGPSPANPSNWGAAWDFVSDAKGKIEREIGRTLNSPAARELAISRLPLAIFAVIAALFIAFGVRLFAVGVLLKRARTEERRRQRLLLGVGATAARLLMLAGASALLFYGLGSTGLFGPVGEATLRAMAGAVMTVIFAYAIGAATFSPQAAGLRPWSLDDVVARRGFLMTVLLGLATAAHGFIRKVAAATSAPDAGVAPLTFTAILIGAFALYAVAQIARPQVNAAVAESEAPISAQFVRVLRRIAVAVAVAAPLLALVGYNFAARFIFFPSVYSLALIIALGMVFFVIREWVEIYLADQGEDGGERLRLIPIFAGFVLFCGALPALALIWGASWTDIIATYDRLVEGFRIGEVSLSPMDFVTFALVFGVGYTLTRAAQRMLKGSVLPKTGMSRGGADALTSGVGYVGIFIAALAAITSAGLDLSNLAIVAGALSVGIGFGLQTIVNNFVSGVILLVERPINVGDWIEVGGVHGTVKKVNVRSTEIETFDRASYILPNSDLISGAVTNYTLGNTVGRVIVPVGVAYGTDTRKVEELLLEAAREHPMVLTSPAPAAYFMAFGASSLDFELRAYLRDVNWVLVTKSDLNFAIEEKLREAGIEVPFAQRDINLKNAGEVARAFRGEEPET